MDGDIHAKVPGTDADPPLKTEEDSACPTVMALAVGHAVTVGVALFTVTGAVPVTVL